MKFIFQENFDFLKFLNTPNFHQPPTPAINDKQQNQAGQTGQFNRDIINLAIGLKSVSASKDVIGDPNKSVICHPQQKLLTEVIASLRIDWEGRAVSIWAETPSPKNLHTKN